VWAAQLGVYYAAYETTTSLKEEWVRRGITIAEKLTRALAVWLPHLALQPQQHLPFLRDVMQYLAACWGERSIVSSSSSSSSSSSGSSSSNSNSSIGSRSGARALAAAARAPHACSLGSMCPAAGAVRVGGLAEERAAAGGSSAGHSTAATNGSGVVDAAADGTAVATTNTGSGSSSTAKDCAAAATANGNGASTAGAHDGDDFEYTCESSASEEQYESDYNDDE
jgi:hypothetical protein